MLTNLTQCLFTFMLLVQLAGFNAIHTALESPSILTTRKKLKILKINKFSQIYHRIEVTGQITTPKMGKESDRAPVYQNQKPPMEPAPGRITEKITDYCWKLSKNQLTNQPISLGEMKTPEGPTLMGLPLVCEFCLQEPHQVFTMNNKEQSPSTSLPTVKRKK